MTHSLTMHADAWISDSPIYKSGTALGYRVTGLPPREEARISNFGGPNHADWRYLRTSNGKSADWTGNYESAQDALAALQRDLL
jgi:hypothetical protein